MATLELSTTLDTTNQVFSLANYDDLKTVIENYANQYKSIIVTEDQIPLAKLDRAELNRRKKAINDVKVAIKKQSLSLLEKQCNYLIEVIDEAVTNIDTQVKAFETKEKEKKRLEIEKIYASKDSVYFELDKIFKSAWLNKTYSLKDIEKEIDTIISQFEKDKETLLSLTRDSNEYAYVLKILLDNPFDLNNAILKLKEYRSITDNINTSDKKQENIKTSNEKIYNIGFIISATASQVELLNDFLSKNNIGVKQIAKEVVVDLLRETKKTMDNL